MRTTLTIDDSLAELLKKQAYETGKPFKQVVNETLRAGLEHAGTARTPREYRIEPAAMGSVRPGVDLAPDDDRPREEDDPSPTDLTLGTILNLVIHPSYRRFFS